jgi:hypothetical protein
VPTNGRRSTSVKKSFVSERLERSVMVAVWAQRGVEEIVARGARSARMG